MHHFKNALVSSGLLLSLTGYGQDVTTPLGALPMQYNGSFAGETGGPRISSNFGLQAGRYYSKRYQAVVSYDQFIPAIRSGIGLTVGYGGSRAANNLYSYSYSTNNYQATLAIAPKFSIRGKFTLSPSLDLSHGRAQTFNAYPPPPLILSFPIGTAKYTSVQSRAGLLFNTPKFYVGYSVILVDRFAVDYTRDTLRDFSGRREQFTSYLQLGYTFRRSSESRFSFTPQLALRIGTERYYAVTGRYRHGVFLEAINLNFQYKWLIWGLNNAGVHVGWQTDRVKIMATNNLGWAGINGSVYTGNLSLRYTFRGDAK